MDSEIFLQQALENRLKNNNHRKISTPKPGLVDFCSNDFLGFGRNLEIGKKVTDAIQNLGSPFSPSSRLICGNHELYNPLEESLAKFHKGEAGIIFNSGYAANLGILSSIPRRNDTILFDEKIHASARDGIRLSLAKSYSFKHNNLDDFEKKLLKAKGEVFVVVEGIYSMDGDSPNFIELMSIKKSNNFHLIVDEAHSNGIAGKNGRGICVKEKIEKNVFARIMTFGKALGCIGSIVIGSKTLIDYLVNFARPLIYTTALPPENLLRIKFSYEKLRSFDFSYLESLNSYFSERFKGFNNIIGNGLIRSIFIPSNEKVTKVGMVLREEGFNIKEIRNPTVPINSERLRICIHNYNKFSQIDELYYHITKLLN